ncbi:hypothetical protein [Hymenobacter sp. CRA2]|uniref:hypothetical protein n=1 Tax=Hymenobacter sp. CRA2 TaxID=1955620 RepID=UPI00098F3027|nr:hypothetical protein [Hymenobacter sp. CRA2]OON70108.1 hypothetical protein B0919_05045 [Hymenobacter sp. CRA2]
MPKFTLLTATTLLVVPAALAQSPITLTQASFPSSAATVERYQDANIPGSIGATATGANQAWDFRALTPTGLPYNVTRLPAPATGGIAGAQWAYDRQATFGRLAYDYVGYGALAPTGWLNLGRTISRQAASLALLTGGANDSAVINRQSIPYGPSGVVNFPLPLTAGGRLSRSFRVATTGSLTIQLASLNRAPLLLVQRYTYVDSVAGWGTVRIPVAGRSTGSDALAVLQVRSRTIRQDSIYLNGSPAPATLLAAFNLQQGAVSTTYFDQFWRNNSAQPLLELYYSSSRFGTPVAADYSVESSVLAARKANLLTAGWQAWPNPLAADQPLQLALPGAQAGEPVRLMVQDGLGRTVLSQPLPLVNGTATLPASAAAALSPGLYTLSVQQGTHQATIKLLRQ